MFGGSGSSDELPPPFTNPPAKDVCIQEMQAYKIKGSATPIAGPTKDNAACPPDGTLLGAFIQDQTVPGTLDAYLSCLATPVAGPVISGKWWFNRDQFSSQFRFEPGHVCGEITGAQTNSKATFEFWNFELINLPLSRFTEVCITITIVFITIMFL